jgi:hypothetical protein
MVAHRGDCRSREIPLVEPLDVPEVTTWGESGGAEAVTLAGQVYEHGGNDNDDKSTPYVVVYSGHTEHEYYRHGKLLDVVTAINYVAGVRR